MADSDPSPIEQAALGLPDESGQVRGAWLDAYLDLRAAGLTWKRAAYAAWFNAPKTHRQPPTGRELAVLLNLKSEQVFYQWQKQDWFKESGIDRLRQAIFQRHIGDVDRATIQAALVEDGAAGVAARKLFYEQAKLTSFGPVEVDIPTDSNFERALKNAYGAESNPDT